MAVLRDGWGGGDTCSMESNGCVPGEEAEAEAWAAEERGGAEARAADRGGRGGMPPRQHRGRDRDREPRRGHGPRRERRAHRRAPKHGDGNIGRLGRGQDPCAQVLFFSSTGALSYTERTRSAPRNATAKQGDSHTQVLSYTGGGVGDLSEIT